MFAAVLTIVLASQVLLIECGGGGNVDAVPANQGEFFTLSLYILYVKILISYSKVENMNGDKLKELLRDYLVQQQLNEEAELVPTLVENEDEQGNEENDE